MGGVGSGRPPSPETIAKRMNPPMVTPIGNQIILPDYSGVKSGAKKTDVLTAGSIVFSDGTKLTQDNSNLYWDDTNNRLGIGTTSPVSDINVYNGAGCDIRVHAGPGGTSSFSFFEGTPTTDPNKDGFKVKYDGVNNQLKIHAVENINDYESRGLMIMRSTPGAVAIGTTDMDGTPAIGQLVVKGTTADGSTNVWVARDSNEANVARLDTDGNLYVADFQGISDRYAMSNTTASLRLYNSGLVGFSSGATYANPDTSMSRISAGVMGFGTGTQGSVAGTVRAEQYHEGVISVNVAGSKVLTDGSATGIFEVAVSSGEMVGGSIDYCIYVTDGTDFQCHPGLATFAAVNKGGTVSSDIDEVYLAASETEVLTAGTLTDDWTTTNGAGKVTINMNANTSLAASAGYPLIKYSIKLHSLNAITKL